MKEREKRVLVGMSGGIDSSAACIMLQEQGYEVVGVTMRTWDVASHFTPGNDQPNEVIEAQELAARLGIEHHVADVRTEFRQVIVQYFIDEYMRGRTPNPCVMCNPLFKERILCEWADKCNCAWIATGHYCQLKDLNGYRYILTGDDPLKDQSYFLWKLPQEILKRMMFPLGGMTKASVRDYLASKGFEAKARGGESMEICFIEKDYREFLKEHCPDIDERIGPGWFVDSKGLKLGQHKGFAYYTIGQRKGLEIALGKPAYVLKINPAKNTVMLGDADQLKTYYMLVEDYNVASLEELLKKSCVTLLIPMELRGQELRIHADGAFRGDLSWTSEAIGNIVKNCMEHTPEGGRIEIDAAENALYSEIIIKDNGTGISPEDLPHIFERFYKGKDSDGKSFGIGLALSRMIIAGQGGTVKAENRKPVGAMFTIRFYKGTV